MILDTAKADASIELALGKSDRYKLLHTALKALEITSENSIYFVF